MKIVKIKCRGEPIFINEEDLEIEQEWFLSLILTYSSDKDSDNVKEIDIGEERELILSVIESIRYNKLIIYNNIPLELMESLSEKWCCPDWLLSLIKEKKEKVNEKKNITDIDDFIMVCKICKVGFKMKENTSTSCKSHSYSYSGITHKFNCCGLNPNLKDNVYCTVGYHTPQDYCFETYEQYKKIKNKNKTTLL